MSLPDKIANKLKSVFRAPALSVPNPRNSDIYLVSYPKSGNTWMRYLLAYAIWPEVTEVDLVKMASYIPSFAVAQDSERMLDPESPCNKLKHRIIKEHTPYNQAARRQVKRAIYIARDGRDAIVSYWHFCNQKDQTSITFSEFIELSAKPNHSYGKWKDHVDGWLKAPLDAKLVIRYEDLLQEPVLYLTEALKFAEIEVSADNIRNAVERASFNEMKKLEKTTGFNLDQLKNVNFVRQGKSGTWTNTFGDGDIERFNEFHGGPVPELGYNW